MKVILLQEVKGKGSEGDVVDVARGYAVNYLLPRKFAIEATSGNLKQLEARRSNIEAREDARRGEASAAAAAIEGKTVRIGARVGDEGRLYGSVTGQMIADAVIDQLAVDIDRRKIDVHGHIKEVGEHVVTVSLHRDVKVDLTVAVVAEGEAAQVAEPTVAEVLAQVEAEEAAEETADESAEASEADEADEATVESDEADAEPEAADDMVEPDDADEASEAVTETTDETEPDQDASAE